MDWRQCGFARAPDRCVSDQPGVTLYRCWGGSSREQGSNYYALEAPTSVFDAELRFNIADRGNEIHFLSTFRLKAGFEYFVGPVGHGPNDLRRPASQAFVPSSVGIKVELVKPRVVLKQDVFVVGKLGASGRDDH